MGKSRPYQGHMIPPDNVAHSKAPWCPCRPIRRPRGKGGALYIHNSMTAEKPDKPRS